MPRKAKNSKKKVNQAKRTQSPLYVPTQAEIRAACKSIQACWTPLEELHRRGITVESDSLGWTPKLCRNHNEYSQHRFLTRRDYEEEI